MPARTGPARRRRLAVAVLAVSTLALTAACSAGDGQGGTTGDDAQVTITVMGKPAATNTAAVALFEQQVADFEAANPGVTIEASDVPWDAKSFAPRLAGGSAPTLLRVPLTEPPSLIERGQVADLSDVVSDVESFDQLNPRVMEFLEQDGAVYGIPEKSYAFGMVYNRDLFEQAGLDPDAPPATWEEVREDAAQIAERTGKTGFGEITTNNSGGWHLTAYSYTYGGQIIEQGADGTWTAAFNDDATRTVIDQWKAMRWEDDSLGDNVLGKQEDVIAEFTAGNVGMFVSAPPDVYPTFVAAGGKPEDFGAGPMPQGGADATLSGATVLMVNATATQPEKEAAVKWMEFRALRPNEDLEVAKETAEASAADGLPVGVPVLPIFDDETYAAYREAIAEHVNVPEENFATYVDSLSRFEYTAEPPVASQEIYAALDPLVQAVLTDPDADTDALLADAEARVNQILEQQAQ
jgi:multiple sugar transport system substrate-binding protein